MQRFFKYACLFLIGAFFYSVMELCFRSYTHFSMAVAGGSSLSLYALFRPLCHGSIIKKCLLACFVITTVEFMSGVFINIHLSLDIWNYSHLPLNFLGQICLLYSFFWMLLAIPMDFIAETVDGFFTSPLYLDTKSRAKS